MHPLTIYLFHLIHSKKSNLCVSADITTVPSMLSLADACGPHMVVFKTHADILSGWDPTPVTGTGAKLAALARKHRFLIFEDRKFADIGSTAQLQYEGGDYRILEWAHIVNAHVISGPDMIRGLKEMGQGWVKKHDDLKGMNARGEGKVGEPPEERGLLLLSQMSSAGNLLDEAYTKKTVSIARTHRDFVMGFIALEPMNSEPEDDFVVMTPGCSLPPDQSLDDSEFVPGAEDPLGQQYVTPRDLILRGCDVIIVGRGICNSKISGAKAEQYKKVAWEAYEERLRQEKK
ncbi:related to orotidine 5'-phosphate decarboxylase [Phialocephala subalpina]|uniref:Orotidine 5'-phosphate decarboxylase n=1 Tax=Phialocephala subalpina TaxID=576137 RepID=A0A1L7WGF5_9HELO|nr:related to orotidine 5'-phosphate decarboxylase [Phialocephala subalpina]